MLQTLRIHRIPHPINRVIVLVREFRLKVPVGVLLQLIIQKLPGRIGTPNIVNDDLLQVLQELNAVLDTVRALLDRHNPQPVLPHLANEPGRRRIAVNRIIVLVLGAYSVVCLPVGHANGTQLIVDIQPLKLALIGHAHIGQRINCIPLVQPPPLDRELLNLLVRNFTQRDVAKHLTPGSCHLAQIFVIIRIFIRDLQMLRLNQELRPQPLPGHREIITVMGHPISPRGLRLNIHPTVHRLGRIVRIENHKLHSTAHQRLVDQPYFIHAKELIQLLIPDVLAVPLRKDNGLYFLRLIRPPKQYLLPRGPVRQHQLTLGDIPVLTYPQRIDRPHKLLKHRLMQRVLYLPERHPIGLRIVHNPQDHLHRRKRRLRRPPAPLEPVMRIHTVDHPPMKLIKSRCNDVGKTNPYLLGCH